MPEQLRRFSHSLVDQYLRCPRKAEFQYVENIPSPKTAALVKGSGCDGAWNKALEAKLDGGDPMPIEELLEVTEAEFRTAVREAGGVKEVDWGDSGPREQLDSAIRLSKQWHLGLYADMEPTAVQVELHRALPSGRDVIGFLDWEGRFDGREVVGDNKTGKRKFSAGEADNALQPSAYAYLKGEAIDFVFTRAVDTGKSQSSEAIVTSRSQGDIDWYAKLLGDVERAFESGVFPTNPTGPLCGPKHCPYYERCMPHRSVSGPAS